MNNERINGIGEIQTNNELFSTTIQKIIQQLEQFKEEKEIPKQCIEKAMEIIAQAHEKGLVGGRPPELVATTALYIACRMFNIPAHTLRAEGLLEYQRLLTEKLGIELPASDPTVYVHKIAERLNLPDEVVKTAIDILQKAKEAKITSSKNPVTLAAAAIYVASFIHDKQIPQQDIARVANTTARSIQVNYRPLLMNYLNFVKPTSEHLRRIV